jgi:hypothetical protein
MLTRIVHNAASLCPFLEQLHLELPQPQRRHLLNLADGLLVCEAEIPLLIGNRRALARAVQRRCMPLLGA